MADQPEEDDRGLAPALIVLAVAVLAGLVVYLGGAGWVVAHVRAGLKALGNSPTAAPLEGGWLDRLFSAPAFLGAVRLTIGALLLLIVVSVLCHFARRQWLTFGGGGPLGIVTGRKESLEIIDSSAEISDELLADNELLIAENELLLVENERLVAENSALRSNIAIPDGGAET